MTLHSPDQLAAHDLLSELRTRIVTQPLPYQYGTEARALQSLWEIFGLARKAMKDHPGCASFAKITTDMLNVDLRPVTAKWHRALQEGLLNSRDGANEFRADLTAIRMKLVAFSIELQDMAYGTRIPDALTPDVLSAADIAECFAPVKFGIDASEQLKNAAKINESEGLEIAQRRKKYDIESPSGTDATGLALSGGGIRSATFCLGVVQVFVSRGLFKHFDYLSTVSGGGYTGSFITSCIGTGRPLEEIGNPYGPDTRSIKLVRQNAKYLSANSLKQRWQMVITTIAGLILNWTAPVAVLATLAWLNNGAEPWISAEGWLTVAKILGIMTGTLIVLYGIFLRFGGTNERKTSLLGWAAGLSLIATGIYFLERGFGYFVELVSSSWSVSIILFAVVISGPAIVRYLPIFDRSTTRKVVFVALMWAAALIVPLLAIICFYLFRMLASIPTNPASSAFLPIHYLDGATLLICIAVACAVFALFFLNINLTGPHKLYRDQLSKTFIQSFSENVLPSLSSINSSFGAPYHLINAAINLPTSTSVVLRDRKADFFLFSKHWCGSPSIEYYPSTSWKSNGTEVDLGTAMAISGAAISSHMGLASMPSLSGLISLLNLRLGFWIKRPTAWPYGVPGFLCLMREMTATGMSEDRKWLNLSDGGHIENMGVYELLRRRCKFIVCVDGEADPESRFAGQLTLIRHAQIDFGVRIEPRFDDIRQDPTSKVSRTHAQLFRVYYPKAEDGRDAAIGLMLYLKLSVTGDEAELLKRYRDLHPEFPHQSTLDQFYDEEQFEAYRQLGVHIAEGVFSPALLTANTEPSTVDAWFKQLAQNLLEPAVRSG